MNNTSFQLRTDISTDYVATALYLGYQTIQSILQFGILQVF